MDLCTMSASRHPTSREKRGNREDGAVWDGGGMRNEAEQANRARWEPNMAEERGETDKMC